MDEYECALRVEEYETLRKELLQNKQYVFERPLLITTAIGVAMAEINDGSIIIHILPIVILIILIANLLFTINRLRSLARIAAYIQVVLEPGSAVEWIGWENALLKSRTWAKTHTKKGLENFLLGKIDPEATPDAMMFYPPIFWFHVMLVALAVIIAISSINPDFTFFELILLIITLVLTIIFIILAFWFYYPSKMTNLIEKQRVTWLEVLPPKNENPPAPQGFFIGLLDYLLSRFN